MMKKSMKRQATNYKGSSGIRISVTKYTFILKRAKKKCPNHLIVIIITAVSDLHSKLFEQFLDDVIGNFTSTPHKPIRLREIKLSTCEANSSGTSSCIIMDNKFSQPQVTGPLVCTLENVINLEERLKRKN